MTATCTTVDTQGMVMIHRVIRREIGMLPRLIRRAAGDPARAKPVAGHATEMLDFLHNHHVGEDELLWPVLRPRVELAGELIDRMERQHEQVAEAAAIVQAGLPGWAVSADDAAGERLATVLEAMARVLREHLAEEEANILPLVARSLTQREWDALARHGFGAIPPRRRLVMLGHILEETNPAERAHMLRKVPAPARIAFRLFGERQHDREVVALRD